MQVLSALRSYAFVAQLAEQHTLNVKVAGSSPAEGTRMNNRYECKYGSHKKVLEAEDVEEAECLFIAELMIVCEVEVIDMSEMSIQPLVLS